MEKSTAQKTRIPLSEIGNNGSEYVVNDQSIWQQGLAEFQLKATITRPIQAQVQLLRTSEGCLVRGKLTGQVLLACIRCAEDVPVDIDRSFEEFENLPGFARAPEEVEEEEGENLNCDESRIVQDPAGPVLDLAALLWEEFLLSLPLSPLCRPDCRGICPGCGANLNSETCTCQKDGCDPRLAVFRNLTLSKKQSKDKSC